MNKVKDSSIATPLIYRGVAYHDYGVHRKLGGIWSKKASRYHPHKKGTWKQIKGSLNHAGYPRVAIYKKGTSKKSCFVHVATHETLNPDLPRLPNITDSQWRRTPKVVKDYLRQMWQVNHRDHNVMNFKPNNLEWVTQQQNNNAYQKHRLKQVA